VNINLLDLFSGIGGFSEGLTLAGFNINNHYFSEIDKHAIAIYKQNFKEAKYVGSVTDVRASDLPRINAITFGSPCQDFSLAGKRAGLEGSRSGLIGEAIRLIHELRPDFFIWENVKGVYSSNAGADYWAVKQAFANLDGYRLESQLLNTAWFLPQNRERIYLVGRLAGKCTKSIFPIRQGAIGLDEGTKQASTARCLTAGGNSGGMHSSMTLVNQVASLNSSQDGKVFFVDGASQCLSAGNGNVPKIAIGAVRGRNPNNPKLSVSGLPTEQMLDINENGISNCLTSVQKDNYVVADYRSDTGFRFKKDGICPTLTTIHGGAGVSNIPSIHGFGGSQSIRRLTEIECERLQGFYSTENVIEFNLCLDPQKIYVNAEIKNLKLQKLALSAGKNQDHKGIVKYATKNTRLNDQQKRKPVQELVLINLEAGTAELHKIKKSQYAVSGVIKIKELAHQDQIGDFALLVALISSIEGIEAAHGRAELLQRELHLTHQKSSSKLGNLFGKEMMQLAKDALIDSTIPKKHLKCITSNRLNISSIEQALTILSYFATHAITGFTQKRIKKRSSYLIRFISNTGWTEYGNYDGETKEVSATNRYKCLGNAVTVNVVQAVGESILSVINSTEAVA